MQIIDRVRKVVRGLMEEVALFINEISGGRVTPNQITVAGVFLHVFVVLAIVNGQLLAAGFLLAIFGLLDSVDGALARMKGMNKPSGVLYDFSADRLKEIMVYTALAYWLNLNYGQSGITLALLALGASMLTTLVKTKAENIVRQGSSKIKATTLNRMFSGGLMRFEIRMFLLVVGLISGFVYGSIFVIMFLSFFTALNQMFTIGKQLDSEQEAEKD